MFRWWMVLVLTVASATASAQPAHRPPGQPSGQPATTRATVTAQETAAASERRSAQLLGRRTALAQRYEGELRAIDRLKQQRTSWRRDRELQDRLSEANETAKQLAAVTRNLAAAQAQLAGARRVLVTAIDAELGAGAAGARAQQLVRLKATLVPKVHRAPHRIVLPNIDFDPNADPEDLDQQAAELRDSELELQRQILGLEKQGTELERVADLRKQHDRAIILNHRDDDQPRRGTQQPSGDRASFETDSAPATQGSEGPGGLGSSPPPESPLDPQSFESEAPVVLADVVDASTIDSLRGAQRSGDPRQRLDAVKKTRDAVARRLLQLREKRALIERRAKDLRKR